MNKIDILTKLDDMFLIGKKRLISFAVTAPHRYKKYEINKRNNRGKRLIAHPSKELKVLQRFLVGELTELLTVHGAATAYRKGKSIKDNALVHAKSGYLLKMDFSNFFYSITPDFFLAVAKSQGILFTDEDKLILSHLLFFRLNRNSKLTLSIGAPSSPLISNFCLYLFDEEISDYCLKRKINYTRYADDLTFSTNVKGSLFEVPQFVKSTLKSKCFDLIKVNESKTVFSSKAHNRHVTGITITNEGRVSIGRQKKREISSLIHKWTLGELTETQRVRLIGYLSFVNHVEPTFLHRLKAKYGERVIFELFKNMSEE